MDRSVDVIQKLSKPKVNLHISGLSVKCELRCRLDSIPTE